MESIILQTKGLSKKYASYYAVRDAYLTLPKGKIYGLIGRNGAGKTTLMRMLLGLCVPTAGEISVFGMNPREKSKEIYSRIGSLIEAPGFYGNLTGFENLFLLCKLRGMKDKAVIADVLSSVGLTCDRKKLFFDYSLGMKQRLGIAAAIIHNPQILILDEPFNGLDPAGITEMRDFFTSLSHEHGISILISSHLLDEAEKLCDLIGIMDKGHITEEMSLENFHFKIGKNIIFEVSDVKASLSVINRIMKANICASLAKECGHSLIEVNADKMLCGRINEVLVKSGISVTGIKIKKNSLEDYFLRMTGENENNERSAKYNV